MIHLAYHDGRQRVRQCVCITDAEADGQAALWISVDQQHALSGSCKTNTDQVLMCGIITVTMTLIVTENLTV